MAQTRSKIDEILDNALAAPASAPSLPKELPDMFDDNSLIPRLTQDDARKLEEYRVRSAAKQAGVDPDIAAAVAFQESGFSPSAVSATGVKGTMQVTRGTAKQFGLDRDDPDQNILAGVSLLKKGLDQSPEDIARALSIYPDPKDLSHWVPSVLNLAERAKKEGSKTIDDVLNTNGVNAGLPAAELLPPVQTPTTPAPAQEDLKAALPPPSSSPDLAATTLAGAKSYLDALGVGFLMRQFGKIPGAKEASAGLYNTLLGGDKSFEDRAKEVQGVTKKAQEEHPIASGVGTVAGILSPVGAPSLAAKGLVRGARLLPGAAKAAQMTPKSVAAAKLLGTGATEAGVYEGTANPDATRESIESAARMGAVTAGVASPISKLVGKGLKKGSEQLINFAVGTKTGSNAGKFIAENLGPALSRAGLKDKAQRSIVENEAKLQSILSDHADKAVDLRAIAQSDDIIKQIERLDNVEQRAKATKLLKILAKFEERGTISVSDANIFKRDLYKQAYVQDSIKMNPKVKSTLGDFYRNIAGKVKSDIETVTSDPQVKILNEKMGDGIQLGKGLDRLDNQSPLSLRMAFQLMAGLGTGGTSMLATSTPGATTIGTAGYKLGKGLENLPPQVRTLLNTLVPQAVK